MSDTPVIFCECGYLPEGELLVRNGVLIHTVCSNDVACDFSYLIDGPPHVATQTHLDYVVCDAHLSAAVNNVASR